MSDFNKSLIDRPTYERKERLMSKETRDGFSRREFLKTGAGVAVGVGCFTRAELKEALAQAKVTGKPLLTEANINSHIAFSATAAPERRDHQAFAEQVREFKRDSKGYITKHFYATPNQLKEFESLGRNTMNELYEALDRCVRERLPFQVRILQGRSNKVSSLGSPSQPGLVPASFTQASKKSVDCDGTKCEFKLTKSSLLGTE
jgi:hypothetical protein